MDKENTKREFKIRAWDKRRDQMVYHIEITTFADGSLTVTNPSSGGNVDDFELMLYTGVKDAFGVEIYEGDIIQNYWNDYVGLVRGVVELKNGRYGAWCRLGLGSHGFVPLNEKGITVVGNVHEHPERLEVKKGE